MNRRLGIAAETALRRILEAKGCQTTRNAASHGKFDVLAVLGGETAVFEVKATTLGSWSALRTTKVRKQIEGLLEFSKEGGLLPVVAIYWAQLDEFRLYSPERILEGIVRPGDADMIFPNPLDIPAASVPSPETSSPLRRVPPRLEDSDAKGKVTPEMREAVDTV